MQLAQIRMSILYTTCWWIALEFYVYMKFDLLQVIAFTEFAIALNVFPWEHKYTTTSPRTAYFKAKLLSIFSPLSPSSWLLSPFSLIIYIILYSSHANPSCPFLLFLSIYEYIN